MRWDVQVSYDALLCERYQFFWRNEDGIVMGRCAGLQILWVVWMEENKRI